jgi:hypothetical protein
VVSSPATTRFNGNFRLEQRLFKSSQRCAVLLPHIRSLTSVHAEQHLKIIITTECLKKYVMKQTIRLFCVANLGQGQRSLEQLQLLDQLQTQINTTQSYETK